jgi:hypothetical protein
MCCLTLISFWIDLLMHKKFWLYRKRRIHLWKRPREQQRPQAGPRQHHLLRTHPQHRGRRRLRSPARHHRQPIANPLRPAQAHAQVGEDRRMITLHQERVH